MIGFSLDRELEKLEKNLCELRGKNLKFGNFQTNGFLDEPDNVTKVGISICERQNQKMHFLNELSSMELELNLLNNSGNIESDLKLLNNSDNVEQNLRFLEDNAKQNLRTFEKQELKRIDGNRIADSVQHELREIGNSSNRILSQSREEENINKLRKKLDEYE
ncbi:MAG: hypothetical protein KAU95_02245 [Candidatus Aenigmarchaeota archaeon]|nr:hypothetical protein [Candidatus Aenigmarchaeota archaeon]